MASYLWEMSSALIHDWSHIRIDFVFNNQDSISQGNGFFYLNMQTGNYLSIPVFGGLIGTFGEPGRVEVEDYWGRQFIVGGGLQLRGKFGRLGAFAGYNWGEHEEYAVTSQEKISKIQWAIVPMVDAREYPLLNYVVRLIDGFFSFDQADFKPYYNARILFKNLHVGDWSFGLGTVSTQNWFDYAAKYTLYSGTLYVSYKQDGLSLEGGYREFFDVSANKEETYQTGPFVRINFRKTNFLGLGEDIALGVFMESGRKTLFQDLQFGLTVHSTISGLAFNALAGHGIGNRSRFVVSAFDYETKSKK
jgi:hypothetical protein